MDGTEVTGVRERKCVTCGAANTAAAGIGGTMCGVCAGRNRVSYGADPHPAYGYRTRASIACRRTWAKEDLVDAWERRAAHALQSFEPTRDIVDCYASAGEALGVTA